ncbi:hypothetical protein Q5X44_18055 [Acinetobacter baumannii]|nr:hypothetical protein [Acinetobacter baumannii]
MDNYKIEVKDEADFKEVAHLVKLLGYGINFSYSNASGDIVKGIFLKSNGLVEWTHRETYFDLNDYKEINLPQLRDLVAQSKLKDQGLISGAEALRALAGGKDVQYRTNFSKSNWADDTATFSAEEILAEETAETDDYNSMKLFFRLKPQTIKLELELPKPFEPQIGDRYWIIHPAFKSGYTEGMFSETDKHESFQQFGAYRTEDDVKKVVEQLRKIRGNNS